MSTVQRVLSPSDWKKRQLDTLKSVGETNYKQGIKTPKKDPIAAGIAAEDAYAAAVKKAIENASRKAALMKTNMGDWFKYAMEIGAGKLVEGVTKREAKVDAFITAFQPLLSTHLGKIDTLESATDAQRENKMLENVRGLKALKGKA